MSVCCECCVLSGRGLAEGLNTRTEESYRLGCVVVCDMETSSMRSQTLISCDGTYEIAWLEANLITLASLQVRLPASKHISL